MNRLMAWAWKCLPGCHPGMSSLIAWAEGKLPEAGSHLLRCQRCRDTALRVRLSLAHANDHDGLDDRHLALGEVFGNLNVRMHAWSALSVAAQPIRGGRLRGANAKRRYDALAVYFGKHAADRIEQSVRRDTPDRHMAPAIEPLFHAFLGRRAAEALTRQIAGTTV